MDATTKIESWAIVELMGHKKIAALATTETFGASVMLRLDIPETTGSPAFTQYYGMSSVYCISPVDEETGRKMAENLSIKPPVTYEMSRAIDMAYQNGRKSVQSAEVKVIENNMDGDWYANDDDDDEDDFDEDD